MGAHLCTTTSEDDLEQDAMELRSERKVKHIPMDKWMSLVPKTLRDKPLFHLAIPGSHNAITYSLDKNSKSPVDPSQPDILQKADKYMKPVIRPFAHKWAMTQDATVTQQLNSGSRYFDLRIAHKTNDHSSNLYFYHCFYSKNTVEAVLREIARWLDAHSKEVVILSFSHFSNMNNQHHEKLVETIRNIFRSKLCPKTNSPTLQTLWASGHQVIVSYEDASIVRGHNDIWSHITYWWANKIKVDELINNLEQKKRIGRPGGFFVTGINLTVDLKYVGKNLHKTLKDVVKSNNKKLLLWLQKQTPGRGLHALNIVAGDFVTEGQFAQVVVSLNNKLL